MNSIDVLRAEYPGDDAWWGFVAAHRPAWEQTADKDCYLIAFNDEDIAIVLASVEGPQAIAWFAQCCAALMNRTPAEVLVNERDGLQIVRSLLMRLPS